MSDDDDLAEITAALSRAEDFSPQELTALRKGWLALTEAGAAHFKTPTDHDQGFARGGAARADDGALTEEELHSIRQGWRALVEDRAHGGKMHYNMPPVAGMMPRGSFKIPSDVLDKLGGPFEGGFVLHSLFGIEDTPDDPTIIHGDVVRIIGNGNINAGRRVLEKFVAQARRAQDHHGWRIEEGEDGVVLHHRRSGNG